MRLLYPVNCLFVLSSNNEGRKKLPPVPGDLELCSVLTAIPACFQPLYRSWPLLLPVAASVPAFLSAEPSWLLLGFCATAPVGPEAVPTRKTLVWLFSSLATASRIKNKLASVGVPTGVLRPAFNNARQIYQHLLWTLSCLQSWLNQSIILLVYFNQ